MKALYQIPYFWLLLLFKDLTALFIKMLGSSYSKKTLILGTFRIVDDKITYIEIEKGVVHKLFGFPIFTQAGTLTDDDWNRILS